MSWVCGVASNVCVVVWSENVCTASGFRGRRGAFVEERSSPVTASFLAHVGLPFYVAANPAAARCRVELAPAYSGACR